MTAKTICTINVLLLLIVFWCVLWWVYNRFMRTKEFHPMGKQLLPTPKWMSCAVPYVSHNPAKNLCENVKFDGWSLGHVVVYLTIGMVLPGYWWQIFALSVVCEAFEYVVGWRARWILDPVANMVGYLLGHMVYVNLTGLSWLHTGNTTMALVLGLASVLFVNRPGMIPRADEWY
jgi:hypothetical protein